MFWATQHIVVHGSHISVKRFRLRFSLIEEATSKISTDYNYFPNSKIVFWGVLEMLLLVISIVCWQRLVTADAGFQSSISSIYAFCWFALPLNMLIVDPSISAFTATRHNTWQSTYTFERQFAAAVFVSLWVDGQHLLVDGQCLVYCNIARLLMDYVFLNVVINFGIVTTTEPT